MAHKLEITLKKQYIKERSAVWWNTIATIVCGLLVFFGTGFYAYEHVTTNYIVNHIFAWNIILTIFMSITIVASLSMLFLFWYSYKAGTASFALFNRLVGIERVLVLSYYVFLVAAPAILIAFAWHHYEQFSLQGAPKTYDNIFAIQSWYNFETVCTYVFQWNILLAFLCISVWMRVYYPFKTKGILDMFEEVVEEAGSLADSLVHFDIKVINAINGRASLY